MSGATSFVYTVVTDITTNRPNGQFSSEKGRDYRRTYCLGRDFTETLERSFELHRGEHGLF